MKIITRKTVLATAVALAFGVSGAALASEHTSDTFGVSANVVADCEVTSTTNLGFGDYNPIVGQDADSAFGEDSAGEVEITCTNGVEYNIALDAGENADNGQRQMVLGVDDDYLEYNLFSDDGHTSAWGADVGTDTVSDTGDGAAQQHTVYGQIPSGQNPTFGSYSDTVTATVSW